MMPGPDSIYATAITAPPSFPAANADLDCDTVVIGGGFTGMTAALVLAENKHDVILLEAQRIGSGGSGRNGGHLCQGWPNDFRHISRHLNADDAKTVWDAGMAAVDMLADRVRKHNIECDLQFGYLHAALHDRQMRDLVALHDDWQARGYQHLNLVEPGAGLAAHIGSSAYVGGLHDARSGHLQPLKYLYGLTTAAGQNGARIFEGTAALAIADDQPTGAKVIRLSTGHRVRAKSVLIAGNAYLANIDNRIMSRRLAPVISSVLATKPVSENLARHLLPQRAAVADCNTALNYFRLDADNRMIFGGRASYSKIDLANITTSLRRRMLAVFPELEAVETEMAWSGRIGITVNRIPHFGSLDENVFFAQGFSGQGVALTGLAGTVLANHVMGDSRLFTLLAKIPHMPFPGGVLRTPALAIGMSWYKMRDWLRL
jgi:gamma-glutamylputrescine oxidase